MRRHADALTADFRRYYGSRVRDYGALEAAALAANLPRESACMRALDRRCAWGDEAYMLWSIEYMLRLLLYSMSEDRRNGADRPEPLPNPISQIRYEAMAASADFQGVADALGIDISAPAAEADG